MAPRRNGSGEIVRAYPAGRGEGRLVFASQPSLKLEHRLSALGAGDSAVLFTGETGTGKSVLARSLQQRKHAAVQRDVSCASLTDSAVAELATAGLASLVSAGGGTLLLDEVAELSPWAQAVLLAGLERCQAVSACVRLISTTHRKLDEHVRDGRFSARLAALIGEDVIALTPLRDRRADIVPLALHHLRAALQRTSWDFVSLDPMVLSRLERYSWPGNARELKNTMERAVALAVDGDISLQELPDALLRTTERALTPC